MAADCFSLKQLALRRFWPIGFFRRFWEFDSSILHLLLARPDRLQFWKRLLESHVRARQRATFFVGCFQFLQFACPPFFWRDSFLIEQALVAGSAHQISLTLQNLRHKRLL